MALGVRDVGVAGLTADNLREKYFKIRNSFKGSENVLLVYGASGVCGVFFLFFWSGDFPKLG